MVICKDRIVLVVAAASMTAAIGSGPRTPVAAQSATGTIEGHVRLNGPAVPSAFIRMGADPYCAELYKGKRVIEETTVLSRDGGLANVFVSLTGTFPPTPVPSEPVLIDQNVVVPTEHQRIFTTNQDGQAEVEIRVFQGRSKAVADNQLLGSFILEGIAPARRMEPKIEVAFRIDENGILSVRARGEDSGTPHSVHIGYERGLQKVE